MKKVEEHKGDGRAVDEDKGERKTGIRIENTE